VVEAAKPAFSSGIAFSAQLVEVRGRHKLRVIVMHAGGAEVTSEEVLPAIRQRGSYTGPSALPTPASLPAEKQVSVGALLLIGQAIARLPGVKAGIAMAATLNCIQENTGLAVESLRRALPAAEEPICSLNATQLGRKVGMSARVMNQHLAACGLQTRNARDEWELTQRGQKWAEAMPYCRHGHSGYQILWNPAVVCVLRELA
jgi:hypothetical protein